MPWVRFSVAPWVSTWLAVYLMSCEASGVAPDWDDLADVIDRALEVDVAP